MNYNRLFKPYQVLNVSNLNNLLKTSLYSREVATPQGVDGGIINKNWKDNPSVGVADSSLYSREPNIRMSNLFKIALSTQNSVKNVFILFCSENTVSAVTESGYYISVFVEPFIFCRAK